MSPQLPAFGRRSVPAANDAAPTPQIPESGPIVSASAAAAVTSGVPSDVIADLRAICLGRLDPTAVSNMSTDQLSTDLERLISEIATERRIQLNSREQRALAAELVFDILGLGPLETLLENDSISEIMVNGPHKVFIERAGRLVISKVRFRDTEHLTSICQRIASAVGRRIDESSPMADARLKDGSRVNIVFPPLALDGPYLSIRKFSRKIIDFQRLIEFGALTQPVSQILQLAAKARLNVIISGGTGSG